MDSRNRELGLLFGLTALQFNFVTRDRLLEVAAPWMANPVGDLGQLLLERGFILPFQHAAVAALVEAQLKTHDGDLTSSLSTLSCDQTLRASLMGRKSAEAEPPSLPQVPPGPDRYRLGEELGRGGVGRVVEAHDPVLKRDVAVKLVLDRASAELRERIVREAEITARLEHPNIVPVHNFGTREDGERGEMFLAMKRVRGRDLRKLLEAVSAGDRGARKSWSRARLLRGFQDICLGVAFVHDRGVIHRDLKPSNVMIGDYGETLIADWGLARLLSARRIRPQPEHRSRPEPPGDATRHRRRESRDHSGFWALQDRVEEHRREAAQAFSRADAALSGALSQDPENAEARRLRVALARDGYALGESSGDEVEMAVQSRLVAEFGSPADVESLRGDRSPRVPRRIADPPARPGSSSGTDARPREEAAGRMLADSGRCARSQASASAGRVLRRRVAFRRARSRRQPAVLVRQRRRRPEFAVD
jgi:hypothetical protein